MPVLRQPVPRLQLHCNASREGCQYTVCCSTSSWTTWGGGHRFVVGCQYTVCCSTSSWTIWGGGMCRYYSWTIWRVVPLCGPCSLSQDSHLAVLHEHVFAWHPHVVHTQEAVVHRVVPAATHPRRESIDPRGEWSISARVSDCDVLVYPFLSSEIATCD
jgi:hypothetical protein